MNGLKATLTIALLLILVSLRFLDAEGQTVISGTTGISGLVLSEDNKPLPGAMVAVFGPKGFGTRLLTDSSGRFYLAVNRQGWYTIYAGYDDPKTPGIDYLPSKWQTYIQTGSISSYTFVLEKGASLYIEGRIWFIEKSRPADFYKFTVVNPDGASLGGSSIRVYGSGSDITKRLGLSPEVVIVPANREMAILVYAKVDQIAHSFLMRGEKGYFRLSQGEALHVDVRPDNLKFNLEVVRSMLDSVFNLLMDAENAGFLVAVERSVLWRAYREMEFAFALLKEESYDESFAELRSAYVLTADSMGKLQGLLWIGSQSALALLFLFVFIASASAYLISDRKRDLRLIIGEKSGFSFSLNPIIAGLTYIVLVGFFYLVFPGCRLIPWETFMTTGIFAFIVGQGVVAASPKVVSERKSDRRSIQFRSAVIAAFSMACRNLRRRKLRTVLSLTNIVILVSGFIALTSISPGYGLIVRRFRPVYPIDAMLIKDRPAEPTEAFLPFIPLPDPFLEWLNEQPNITLISPKAENTPRGPMNPLGYLRTKDGDSIMVQGVIGISPSAEANVTSINETVVIGEYLEDDDPLGVLVSSTFYERYGIRVGDKLYGFNRAFVVRGFFDPKALEALRDLNEETMLPYEIGPFNEPVPVQAESLIIINYETALQLPDVRTSRVIIQLEDPEAYRDFADVIVYSWEYGVYIAHPSFLETLYVGEYLEVEGMGLIPFLMTLVILNIGASTMGSVRERRDEIAALLSVGLNPTHIACLFVAEAAVLGFIGGGLGFLSGISGYRLFPTVLLRDLQVREKVSAEWGLAALFMSGLTAILASLIPALRASTMITPSLRRRWSLEAEVSRKAEREWILDLPIKLRRRELEPFVGFIIMRLREEKPSQTWLISGIKFAEESAVEEPLRRIMFNVSIEKFGRSENEIIICRRKRGRYFDVKMICRPERQSGEIAVEIATYIRRLILEWEALTFEVASPFDPSLRQLYTLVNAYTPTSLYVIATKSNIEEEIDKLKRRLELEGLKPPRFVISWVDPLDVKGCMRLTEDIVSRVDVVCISGGPAAITSSLAMNALKQRKMICYVIDPEPPEERRKKPFENLKIVNL